MSSTIRTNVPTDMPVSGTIVNCNSELGDGRVQVCPDTFSVNIPETDCPWCYIDTNESQTMVGSTPHTKSGLRPGMRVSVRFTPDGTGHVSTTWMQSSQGDAQPGQAAGNPYDPTTVSVASDKGTGTGVG